MAEPQANPPPALISCDEAGFTGPTLLDDDQPIFAYAAIDLSAAEGDALVTGFRAKYRIQAPELKSKLLRKRANWPAIALDLAEQVSSRALVIAADKHLNLGGKAFEYLVEPVLQAKSGLFYHYDLHRFVMNALYRAFFIADKPVPQLAHELQAFMKSFDPADARPCSPRRPAKRRRTRSSTACCALHAATSPGSPPKARICAPTTIRPPNGRSISPHHACSA
ncbi:MAG: hypothetical protein J0I98_23060 [Mesorhizobium sp.]|jgi:hypothetical protein|nr:hypothetical protein [Mesorhizobium sp.]MBN9245662.1 hypothetical protein [Mesorhizobium sp.]